MSPEHEPCREAMVGITAPRAGSRRAPHQPRQFASFDEIEVMRKVYVVGQCHRGSLSSRLGEKLSAPLRVMRWFVGAFGVENPQDLSVTSVRVIDNGHVVITEGVVRMEIFQNVT